MLRFGRHRRLGVTVGATSVDAAAAGGPMPAWSRAIEPLAAGAPRWPALAEALRELRTARHSNGAALTVTLLPPLVEIRPVVLPPLADDEARQVVVRNPARYFLAAKEPQVIGVAAPPAHANGGPRTRMAAAAPARIVEAIHAAAQDAGWVIDAVVPAAAAWRTAALVIWPALRQGSHDVAVLRSGHTEVLRLENGVLAGVRRFGAASAGASALREALVPEATATPASGLAILGPASLREALISTPAARGAGARIMVPPDRWAALAESPELTAAAFAAGGGGVELVSESARRLRGAQRVRMTWVAAAAAGALFVVASGLEFWGARRQLAQVEQERAALRPKVAALVATRDSAALVGRWLSELAAATDDTLSWYDLLTTVTRALPRDVYLTAFRVTGDSLVLEGIARRAADVFDAIEALPAFADVRSAAPVRRDLGDRQGTDVPERFSVGARVTSAHAHERLARSSTTRRRP